LLLEFPMCFKVNGAVDLLSTAASKASGAEDMALTEEERLAASPVIKQYIADRDTGKLRKGLEKFGFDMD